MSEVETALPRRAARPPASGGLRSDGRSAADRCRASWTGSVSSRRHRILLLTFTRRAAEEMIRKVMVRITSGPRSRGLHHETRYRAPLFQCRYVVAYRPGAGSRATRF